MPKLAGLLARIQTAIAERKAARAEADQMASRASLLYNPPEKPPRPFELDYPNGSAPNDSALPLEAPRSILRSDMDGRPLTAGAIVGRTVVDGRDMPLPPGEIDALAEKLIGSRPEAVPRRQLGGDSGRITRTVDPATGEPRHTIQIDQNLSPELQQRAAAHEVAHFIDDAAGGIDTKGLSRELAPVYNTLSTGQERARNLLGPQHLGYAKDEQPRELVAEAIRAYMADPNYLKTVAPSTAAAIRAAVNDNPRLRNTIQFNTLAALGVGAGALTNSPQAQAPNRLIEMANATGIAEPVEHPALHSIADSIDSYRAEHPLVDYALPLEGSADLLRSFGRDRPVKNRLLEVINLF